MKSCLTAAENVTSAAAPHTLPVRELVGWGLDADAAHWRDAALAVDQLARAQARARRVLLSRGAEVDQAAWMEQESIELAPLFAPLLKAGTAQRDALDREFAGLDWSLGVVDLRRLFAFQRRLVLNPCHDPRHDSRHARYPLPCNGDWPALLALAAGAPRSTEHQLRIVRDAHQDGGLELLLSTSNPDLCARVDLAARERDLPILLHGGSPFFEVGEFRGRWFLRDGYHRAYHLLRAGVSTMVAVLVRARSLEELGANKPWFFSEEVLFSQRAPRVTDFLSEDLTVTYARPRLTRTIRIRIEESFDEEVSPRAPSSSQPMIHNLPGELA